MEAELRPELQYEVGIPRGPSIFKKEIYLSICQSELRVRGRRECMWSPIRWLTPRMAAVGRVGGGYQIFTYVSSDAESQVIP